MSDTIDEDETLAKSRKNTVVRYQDENGKQITNELYEELRNAQENIAKQKIIEETKKVRHGLD